MFRRAFSVYLMVFSALFIGNSIVLRYAAWPGGAMLSPMSYWWNITFTESWVWVALFVVGLCVWLADREERTAKGGPIG